MLAITAADFMDLTSNRALDSLLFVIEPEFMTLAISGASVFLGLVWACRPFQNGAESKASDTLSTAFSLYDMDLEAKAAVVGAAI
jgi:hypothetical protein